MQPKKTLVTPAISLSILFKRMIELRGWGRGRFFCFQTDVVCKSIRNARKFKWRSTNSLTLEVQYVLDWGESKWNKSEIFTDMESSVSFCLPGPQCPPAKSVQSWSGHWSVLSSAGMEIGKWSTIICNGLNLKTIWGHGDEDVLLIRSIAFLQITIPATWRQKWPNARLLGNGHENWAETIRFMSSNFTYWSRLGYKYNEMLQKCNVEKKVSITDFSCFLLLVTLTFYRP